MDNDSALNDDLHLWRCDRCKLWWYSEPTAPNFWRLIRLADPVLDPLWQMRCPGYKVFGPNPSVCPECAATMTQLTFKQSRNSIFAQGLLSSLVN
ncbi:MAG: hypothetical protein HC875_04310 [Anaerolineales bacterium]|nr:hypothetical protein [Anaerolineales bacterium]